MLATGALSAVLGGMTMAGMFRYGRPNLILALGYCVIICLAIVASQSQLSYDVQFMAISYFASLIIAFVIGKIRYRIRLA